MKELNLPSVARVAAALLLGGTLVFSAQSPMASNAAESAASNKTEWSLEADCAACHEKQAISFESVEPAVESAGAEDKDKSKTGAEKAGGSEAQADANKAVSVAPDKNVDGEDEAVEPLATTHAGVMCAACHNDEEKLAEAHENATGPKLVRRLKYTYVETQTCLICHDSWESLAEKTEDCTMLTDSSGTVVNPHAAPATHTQDSGTDKAYVACYMCHDMHGTVSVEEQADYTCQGCHHEDVYECHTCHE